MNSIDLDSFEKVIQQKITEITAGEDPAHDLSHFKRVVKTAKELCLKENANMSVVMPAAWLHDFVIVPKNDPRRKLASTLSAEKAIEFLKTIQYPEVFYQDIAHAIKTHSFSAGFKPETLEAKIVQDADRLDALGAIGIARCFATAGLLKRSFYEPEDPFAENRSPDDSQYTVDHFYIKLFKIAENLQTEEGRKEGHKRVQVMKAYLADLANEI